MSRKKTPVYRRRHYFLLVIVAGARVVFLFGTPPVAAKPAAAAFLMALTHELKHHRSSQAQFGNTAKRNSKTRSSSSGLYKTTLQKPTGLMLFCNNMLLSSQIDARGLTLSRGRNQYQRGGGIQRQWLLLRFPAKSSPISARNAIFVLGDRLLQMAINNLVDNAIKYSSKRRNAVTVEAQRQNNSAVLMVKDGEKVSMRRKKKRSYQILPYWQCRHQGC